MTRKKGRLRNLPNKLSKTEETMPETPARHRPAAHCHACTDPLAHAGISRRGLITGGAALAASLSFGRHALAQPKPHRIDVHHHLSAPTWLDAVKGAWSECEEFDVVGRFLTLRKVRAFPKPFGGTRPIVMNAASSVAGQDFALRNCDAFFTATAGSRTSLEGNARRVEEIKGKARAFGRDIEVYTVGQVICRPSQQEAEDYYRHVNIEHADWDAIDGMLANKSITPQTIGDQEYEKKRRYFAANAIGGYPFVGTPDRVAEELAIISQAGVRGIGLSFVNYLAEVPYFCDEVLPRLQRAGVRMAH